MSKGKAHWGREARAGVARGHQHLGHPCSCVLAGGMGEGSFLQGKQAHVKAKLFLGGSFLESSGKSSHGTGLFNFLSMACLPLGFF